MKPIPRGKPRLGQKQDQDQDQDQEQNIWKYKNPKNIKIPKKSQKSNKSLQNQKIIKKWKAKK